MSLQSFELPRHLRFSPSNGLIELAGSRVMLFNQTAMASLHQTLMNQVGAAMSRMILARFGYDSATRDYQALESLFPDLNPTERLQIGPLMHSWSGIVGVEPEVSEFDKESGHFFFKGRWVNSYEARLHLDLYGKSETPVCFSLAGYGSGWCSSWFGQRLLEVETKCVACGDPYCEWEIRPWEEWGPEADPWKAALSGTSRSIHRDLEQSLNHVRTMNESMNQRVEEKSRAHRDFLRMICHDIESPLKLARTGVSAYLQETKDAHLAVAETQLSRVHSVVERAKAAAVSDDGKFSIQCERHSLRQSISESIKHIQVRAAVKNIQFDVRADGDISAFVDGDLFNGQVLGNIMSNAVKFSPANAVIKIDLRHDATGYAVLEVSDQGRGMPREVRERVFDPRKTKSAQGTFGETGLGYGLSIAHAAMQAMNGRIEIDSLTIVESPLEHGTTVRLWIPIEGETHASLANR